MWAGFLRNPSKVSIMSNTKVTEFSSSICKAISIDVNAALKAVGAKYGLNFQTRGGTYGDQVWTIKLEAGIVSKGGVVASKASEDFKRYAKIHKIPLSALGQSFRAGKRSFILRGYLPKAKRFPFSAECEQDGKLWRLPAGLKTRIGYTRFSETESFTFKESK